MGGWIFTDTDGEVAAMRALCSLLVGAVVFAGCGSEEEPPPPPPTRLVITIADGTTGQPIPNAQVIVRGADRTLPIVTADSGVSTIEVSPGAYTFSAQAAGYIDGFRTLTPASTDAVANQDTAVTVALEPLPGSVAGGTLTGRVTRDGSGIAGVLVIAQSTGQFSSHTDGDGRFTILGVAPGFYQVRAVQGGFVSSMQSNIEVTVGGTVSDVELTLSAGGTRITGMLGPGAGMTRVTIVDTGSGDRVPGVEAQASLNGPYTLAGVPPGTYAIEVAREDDDRVLDPDLMRSGMAPTSIQVADHPVTVDLPTAPSMSITAPTLASDATLPVTFSWDADPNAGFYVIEVRNVTGQVLWGGLDTQRRTKFRILAADTSIEYGALGTPNGALEAGGLYSWRVFAGRETQTGTLYELIGGSEEQAGVFRVAR